MSWTGSSSPRAIAARSGGKALATFAFLLAAQAVALPAFVLFFEPLDATAIAGVLLADVGICAVGSLHVGHGGGGASARVAPAAPVPPAGDPADRGGVGGAVSTDAERFLLFLAPARRGLRGTLAGVLRVRRHGVTT